MTQSPFRTGSTIRYGIEVYCDVADMVVIRELCADLIEGIDQSRGEQISTHTTLTVEPASVGEAVRRLNHAGYTTDEDPDESYEDDLFWKETLL
jgi:hypothetical protein